jgi:hypothetical protein
LGRLAPRVICAHHQVGRNEAGVLFMRPLQRHWKNMVTRRVQLTVKQVRAKRAGNRFAFSHLIPVR